MRALKKRFRADNLPNEIRAPRGSVGRYIYLVLLGFFALAVFNYLFGDLVLLRADGLVLRDETVVATTYMARVDEVEVRQGEGIAKGVPILKLQSLEILERLADLSIKRAELVAKATDFKIRTDSVGQLLPLAERRESESLRVIQQFDAMAKQGFMRSAPYAVALNSNYEARRDHVNLTSESRVLKDEVSALDGALADAEKAFTDLTRHYAAGSVYSPVTGSIGAVVPLVGHVYRPGEPMLSIYSGDPYVLVYLPHRYLFPITVGLRLQVSDGQFTENGVVKDILPVTATLPQEFQNTFQPTNRNQLAKIKLDSSARFPINQKVVVTRSLLGTSPMTHP